MSDYTRVYNFTVKDALPTGDSGKVIKGTELDVELNAVAAAIASKADSNSPTLTGTPVAPTASAGTNSTQLATTAFVQTAFQKAYPVGSIYMNAAVSTNPATLLGFGTWVAFGTGKMLIGIDSGDTIIDTLEETGGSKNAVVVSHTHTVSDGAHTHTITDPGHTHSYVNPQGAGASYYPTSGLASINTTTTGSSTTGITINESGSHTHTVSTEGSSGTNANLPPYIVVAMWKRTA